MLEAGDLVIDGGNSRYTDDAPNAVLLDEKGIGYLDVGVSGGIWGKANGYGLMAGGASEHVELAMPIFDALRPEGPREEGFAHAGPVGAGHYSKMVHNGIEYGLMQAYAEGFELLSAAELVNDVPAVLQAWSRGTVVRSWLLDLLVIALKEDPGLAALDDYVDDSGEGRWTIEEAITHAVPLPVISAALFARFASRQESSPAMQRGGGAAPTVRRPRRQVGGRRRPASRASDAGPSSGTGSTQGPDHAPATPRRRRLPVVGTGRARPGAGGHRAARPERGGQDQPGRGGRLPGHARFAPGGHRRAADPPGRERAVVRGLVVHRGRELSLSSWRSPRAGPTGPGSTGRRWPGPRDVLGILRTVLFAPEDLALVRGDPAERRRFLDDLLVARFPRYAAVRADYERVLSSATALLKTARAGGGDLRTLDVWDGHLAQHGAALLAARLRWSARCAPVAAEAFAEVAPERRARLALPRHRCSLDGELPTRRRRELRGAAAGRAGRVRRQELDRGVCLVGPHRDDLELHLGAGPAKGYASHGESWSLALALRLASLPAAARPTTWSRC